MKKKILFLLILPFITSCSSTKKSISIDNKNTIKADVNLVLNNWHLAAAEANFDAYFGKMDTISVFIGTDASENWTKKEFSDFSKPYFDKGKAWSFEAKKRNIRFNKQETIAWFDEVLDTWMGDCRATGVLSLNNTEWKLEHYQLSITIDNELMPQFLNISKSNYDD